jgi:hypothetical protein
MLRCTCFAHKGRFFLSSLSCLPAISLNCPFWPQNGCFKTLFQPFLCNKSFVISVLAWSDPRAKEFSANQRGQAITFSLFTTRLKVLFFHRRRALETAFFFGSNDTSRFISSASATFFNITNVCPS